MKQHRFLKITISLILLIALITAASIFLSYNVLTVRTFSYETDKAVDPVRAVVISDLHEHEFGKDNVKLVEKIRAGAGYYFDGGGFCESGFDGVDGCGEAGGAT